MPADADSSIGRQFETHLPDGGKVEADAAYQAFRDLIVAHLLQKGWKRLLGKRIRYEQSLFEHSLNTLDVVLTYLAIFRQAWHPPLTRDEEVALIVTAVAHDAGKATDDFQRYIRGGDGLG